MNAKVTGLKVEHFFGNTSGVGTSTPRLSWSYIGVPDPDEKIQIQCLVNKDKEKFISDDIVTLSKDNVLVPWPFKPLKSLDNIEVKARLVGDDCRSEWSNSLKFNIGILDNEEMTAAFIGANDNTGDTDFRPLPLINRKFTLRKEISSAKMFVSALGLVKGFLNGKEVGSDVLNPGWTSYNHRVMCWTYDVTEQLDLGKNMIGLVLGDGWYRGRIGFYNGQSNYYGTNAGAYVQLEIDYKDGTHSTINSNSYDSQWKWHYGPYVSAGIYEGEVYDARREISGWNEKDFDNSNWERVAQVDYDPKKLQFPPMDAILPTGVNRPVSIKKIKSDGELGDWIVDFGQNCSQLVKLDVSKLKKDDHIIISHAEILDNDNRLVTRPLRRATATDQFISDGNKKVYQPEFTMHGFRYAEVDHWRGELRPEDIEAVVYHTKMQKTGGLSTSNEMVNKLQQNIEWSLKSNFLSLPTDCPQRDERLGWTGDIALFAESATYLYDVHGLLSNWLEDARLEQKDYSTMPFWVPYVPLRQWDEPVSLAVWGDAAVLVPWALYQESGDKDSLKNQYPVAKHWADHVAQLLDSDGVWGRKPDFRFGQLSDWLDPSAPSDDPQRAMTDKSLVATAFFANSCHKLSIMAHVLGLEDDSFRYAQLFDHIRSGFNKRYVKSNGSMQSDTETAYSIGIMFELFESDLMKQKAGDRLAELVRNANGKIQTGFAGTPYILPALSKTNHDDEAISLFLSTKCPSWMYQVTQGATSTWERWDSLEPDGTLNPGEMTSFNHYALGAVNNWMHEKIGGIKSTAPSWETFEIDPIISSEEIDTAVTEHKTPYGLISLNWHRYETKFTMNLSVPYGTMGTLKVKGLPQKVFTPGNYSEEFILD